MCPREYFSPSFSIRLCDAGLIPHPTQPWTAQLDVTPWAYFHAAYVGLSVIHSICSGTVADGITLFSTGKEIEDEGKEYDIF